MIRVYVTFLQIAYCSFLTNKFYVICKKNSKKKRDKESAGVAGRKDNGRKDNERKRESERE